MFAAGRAPFPALIGVLFACAGLAAWVGRAPRPGRTLDGPVPHIRPENAYAGVAPNITIRASQGGRLWYSTQPDGARPERGEALVSLTGAPSSVEASRSLAIPTAMQWRHPLLGLPAAMVVHAAEEVGGEGVGPFTMRTFLFQDHGALPVVSISTPADGLYGEEEGIAVVGDAMLHAPTIMHRGYARDPVWWKYPGNFHERGKEWERQGRMQLIAPDGSELLQTDVGIRINGQMTRGFPQHSWRLLFDEPLRTTPFADGDGVGSKALVLRAAGNDQVKAMLRDAFQHTLCEDLPFETSRARTCVLYINGAYQGVHHLRQRMDEKELARRYGVPASRIALLEDDAVLAHGKEEERAAYIRMVEQAEKASPGDTVFVGALAERLDVDGFLTYMASQMVLGNRDWPMQNVKCWRYTGKPKAGGSLDGRWHFVMGDSDLSFGANWPVEADMFENVRSSGAHIARLYRALMRHRTFKQRFAAIVRGLAARELSPERCAAVLRRFTQAMDPEMERHTARWRKPRNKAQWLAEVQVMETFAAQRAGHVLKAIERFESE